MATTPKHDFEDVDRLLKSRGYTRWGEYSRTWWKNEKGICMGVTEHELSFGMFYSFRARFVNDPNGPEWGQHMSLNNIPLEKFYQSIEEIEVGVLLTLPQMR